MENTENQELMTTKRISETMGVSEGKVKKAIKELNLEHDSARGVCKYYGAENFEKIKNALQK